MPGSGPTATYSYDAVGGVLGNGSQNFSYDDDRRLSRIGTLWPNTTFDYDGRGYLMQSSYTASFGASSDVTSPTYNSAGLFLHRYAHRAAKPLPVTPASDSDLYVFYFAGRPVATLEYVTQSSTTTSTLRYLSVDHLGTPILETNTAGAQVWQGGFEPFGTDISGASPSTVLRFPGQWSDSTWNGNKKHGLYYNVNRWYEDARGRYTQPDPLGLDGGPHLYLYTLSNPVNMIDPLGLLVQLYCHPIGAGGGDAIRRTIGRAGFGHCFVRVKCECQNPYDNRLEVTGRNGSTGLAEIPGNPPPFGLGHNAQRVAILPADNNSKDCATEDCIMNRYHQLRQRGYPYGSPPLGYERGPNSNTFANDLLRGCGVRTIMWPSGIPPFTGGEPAGGILRSLLFF